MVVVKVERLLMLTHGYMCRYDTSSGLGEKTRLHDDDSDCDDDTGTCDDAGDSDKKRWKLN